jgi:8-oxo-dGTP pyrophosphatase MutT (NUDIX family)
MSNNTYLFQYCQKLIVFSKDWSSVLLARRFGENDYDGTFSFIGGKMETSDAGILEGLSREKSEEIGKGAKVAVYPHATYNILFRKNDGNSMIIPHYVAQYQGGKITLNPEEYSEYQWVPIKDLPALQPKIDNIPELVEWAFNLKTHVRPEDFVNL